MLQTAPNVIWISSPPEEVAFWVRKASLDLPNGNICLRYIDLPERKLGLFMIRNYDGFPIRIYSDLSIEDAYVLSAPEDRPISCAVLKDFETAINQVFHEQNISVPVAMHRISNLFHSELTEST
jgi:hypothetical protein